MRTRKGLIWEYFVKRHRPRRLVPMGDYTGFYCDVVLKPELIPVVRKAMDEYEWSGQGYDYMDVYAKDEDAMCIPFGSLHYMPDNFPEFNDFDKMPQGDGRWIFSCSLKNTNNTIENFLYNVLPHMITHSNEIESIFENDKRSTSYGFRNGVIVKLPQPGRFKGDYCYDDDDDHIPKPEKPVIIDI